MYNYFLEDGALNFDVSIEDDEHLAQVLSVQSPNVGQNDSKDQVLLSNIPVINLNNFKCENG